MNRTGLAHPTISGFRVIVALAATDDKPCDPWKSPQGGGSLERDREAAYEAALKFVNIVEPNCNGGLARAYQNKAGKPLWTLEEVVGAARVGELKC